MRGTCWRQSLCRHGAGALRIICQAETYVSSLLVAVVVVAEARNSYQ